MKIAELHDKLLAATERLKDAERFTSAARSSECTAVNEVNALQKEFDKELDKLRESSPGGTDWARARQPKYSVAA